MCIRDSQHRRRREEIQIRMPRLEEEIARAQASILSIEKAQSGLESKLAALNHQIQRQKASLEFSARQEAEAALTSCQQRKEAGERALHRLQACLLYTSRRPGSAGAFGSPGAVKILDAHLGETAKGMGYGPRAGGRPPAADGGDRGSNRATFRLCIIGRPGKREEYRIRSDAKRGSGEGKGCAGRRQSTRCV